MNNRRQKFQYSNILRFKHSKTGSWNLKFLTLILILFVSSIYSCDNNALFDSGKTTTREILINQNVSAFEAESIFDITVVQDTINKILITCGENLQQFVDITIKNDTVHMKQRTKENWSRKYEKIKLELYTKQNLHIDIHEPVHLTTRGIFSIPNFVVWDWTMFSEIDVNLDVDYCELINSPEHFGVIKAKGKSKSTFLWNRGSCQFLTDSLESVSCYVKQHGWGDMYVNATDNLTVSLEFTGNVFYKGNPSKVVIENQLSSGKLIKMDSIP